MFSDDAVLVIVNLKVVNDRLQDEWSCAPEGKMHKVEVKQRNTRRVMTISGDVIVDAGSVKYLESFLRRDG